MNINKAIKKQGKSINRFLLLMGFIFFGLTFAYFFTHSYQSFISIYLIIIEITILTSMVIVIDYYNISCSVNGYKIVIKQGIFAERINISGDKVVFVGTEDKEKDFQIIIISTVNIRGKNSKKIDEKFLIKYGYISSYYLDILKKRNEDAYYYVILNKGGLKKYTLISSIYKACVYAEYSDEAIEKIKAVREGIK